MEKRITIQTFDAFTELNKKYLIQMFVADKLLIFIGNILENLHKKEYQCKKTIEEMKKEKIYLIYDSLDEIIEMILCNLENNKKLNINSKIIEETNKIILKIPVNFGKIKELNFEMDKIENSIDEKIGTIFEKSKEENKRTKDEITELKLKISNDEKEIEKLKSKINNIEETLKDLQKKLEIRQIINTEKNELFVDSMIVLQNEGEMISNWIIPNRKLSFELLFRASRDGDKTDTFHNKCDGKGNTITFIKVANGYRFGGYTTIPWNKNGGGKKDPFSFMFSLDNKVKAELKNKDSIAVWHASDIGPGFSDYDLLLYNDCLKNDSSFVDISHFCSDNLKFIGVNKSGRYYTRIIDYETYLVKL